MKDTLRLILHKLLRLKRFALQQWTHFPILDYCIGPEGTFGYLCEASLCCPRRGWHWIFWNSITQNGDSGKNNCSETNHDYSSSKLPAATHSLPCLLICFSNSSSAFDLHDMVWGCLPCKHSPLRPEHSGGHYPTHVKAWVHALLCTESVKDFFHVQWWTKGLIFIATMAFRQIRQAMAPLPLNEV